MTPEAKVKKRVRQVLDKHEVYYFFPPANGYGRVGVPDIVCCVNGYFLAVECKAGGNKPTALQERELDKIAAAGGISMVVNEDAIDGLEAVVERLKSGGELQ